VETIRHWRNNRRNLRLEGEEIETPDGTKLVRISGNSWHELSSNGHHKKENPLEGIIVYPAQTPPGKNGHKRNGREPTKISGEVKILASVS